jgi:DNA repair protein REV1
MKFANQILCRYKEISLKFYTILMSFADDLQAVSVDEALIEVTSIISRMKANEITKPGDTATRDAIQELAGSIRAQIKRATGCTGGQTS